MMSRIQRAMSTWWSKERGFASTALIILSIPMILGAFGYGFDAMRLYYAKRYLQGRLDIATQSGAAITFTNPGGNIRLGEVGDAGLARASIEEAEVVFDENTQSARASGSASLLGCDFPDFSDPNSECGSKFEVAGNLPNQGFNFCRAARGNEVYGLKGKANEYVDTIFLRMVGVDRLDFEVTSESLYRWESC